eukprot:762333-Rhodomonas_salina.1
MVGIHEPEIKNLNCRDPNLHLFVVSYPSVYHNHHRNHGPELPTGRPDKGPVLTPGPDSTGTSDWDAKTGTVAGSESHSSRVLVLVASDHAMIPGYHHHRFKSNEYGI